MNMFEGFTDGTEITEDSLNAGGGGGFNFPPSTNAVFRLIDVETKQINPTFGGIEYTLEMISNDEGVSIGDQKRHLFKTVQDDTKKAGIENSYFKASASAMGVRGKLDDKSQIIGKLFMADVTIFKADSGKEYQNMKNFRPVEVAKVSQAAPAAQPSGGFGAQPQGFGQGGFGR